MTITRIGTATLHLGDAYEIRPSAIRCISRRRVGGLRRRIGRQRQLDAARLFARTTEMSRKWDEVADHRLRQQVREGVFASRRFWIGFATTWAVLLAGYAIAGMLIG